MIMQDGGRQIQIQLNFNFKFKFSRHFPKDSKTFQKLLKVNKQINKTQQTQFKTSDEGVNTRNESLCRLSEKQIILIKKWYKRTSGSKGYRCEPSLIPFLKAELLCSQMKNVKFDQFFIFSCLLRRHLTYETCLKVAIGRRSQF